MRKPVVLVTGASGEIGHGLLQRLAAIGARAVVTLDVVPLDPGVRRYVQREVPGSILDRSLLERVLAEYRDRSDLSSRGASVDARGVLAAERA